VLVVMRDTASDTFPQSRHSPGIVSDCILLQLFLQGSISLKVESIGPIGGFFQVKLSFSEIRKEHQAPIHHSFEVHLKTAVIACLCC